MRYTILVLTALCAATYAADGPILGYDEASSAVQREAEALLDASIDAQEMDGWMKHMTSQPHHVGSPKSKENAEYIAGLLESWGYTVELINDNTSESSVSNAMDTKDVLLVASSASAGTIGTKLTNLSAPVVSELGDLADELGFATAAAWGTGESGEIVDPTHYITYPFAVAGPKVSSEGYGVRGIPTLVLLDPDGKVGYVSVGSGGKAALKAAIKKRLAALKKDPDAQ